MLRRTPSSIVGGLLAVVLVTAPSMARAAPSVDAAAPVADEDAADQYHEGEDAYRLGKFDIAIEKFERAYSLSKQPSLLYNVGLSYFRNYELSRKIEDLRSAKVVLDNYFNEIEKDPEVGDLDEARSIIAEVESAIEAAEAGESPDSAGDGMAPMDDRRPASEDEPNGEDPGRAMRRWGVAGLVVGTGGVVLGVASGVTFAVLRKNANESGNFQRAKTMNGLAYGLGIGLSVVGAAVLTGGAILLSKGKKKTAAWKAGERAELMLVPDLGGLSVVGRF
jgi:tetratricopeptide (TPR) repeat protein